MCSKIQIRTASVARREPITEIEFEYPVLTIFKNGKVEDYTVAEFIPGAGWEGQAFKLTKSNGEHYNVFVCRRGQNHLCDCKGFEACGNCKHHDSIRHLLWEGELDDPRGKAPFDNHPSPQQLADEAGVELPF